MPSRDEHAEIRELSGLAALRALTPEEAQHASAHLATCADCRAEFAELRATADLLLRVPEPVAPPPDLRARILAAVQNEPQERAAPRRIGADVSAQPADGSSAEAAPRSGGYTVGARGQAGDAEASRPTGEKSDDGRTVEPIPFPVAARPARRWDWRDLGMVASLAAAFYFGYWTLRLQGDVAANSARLAQQEALVRAATDGRVVQIAATNVAPQVRGAVAEGPDGTFVYLDNLPQPAADRAYEVWLIPPGGQPVGVGLSSAGQGGTQRIPVDRPLAGMQQIAVTQEPAGGSPGPTSAIVAAAKL